MAGELARELAADTYPVPEEEYQETAQAYTQVRELAKPALSTGRGVNTHDILCAGTNRALACCLAFLRATCPDSIIR